jgi:Leucine-rich repeat (LRR) protein
MSSSSPSFRPLSSAGPSESERRLAQVRPVGGRIDICGWGVGSLEGLFPSSRVEALYARANSLRTLDGIPALPQLRVLDVSNNLLTDILLPRSPLRILYLSANNLTDPSIIPTIPTLEVLSIASNRLISLEGLHMQPELKVLSIASNDLHSFAGLPVFPKLESLRAEGNPVAGSVSYRKMAVCACSTTLERLDGIALEGVAHDLSIRACYALRRGLVYADESQADAEASQVRVDLLGSLFICMDDSRVGVWYVVFAQPV